MFHTRTRPRPQRRDSLRGDSGRKLRARRRPSRDAEPPTMEVDHHFADIAFERAVVDTAGSMASTDDWTNPLGGAPGPQRPIRDDPWSFMVRFIN